MALQVVLLPCMFLFAFSIVSFNEQGFDSNQALCIFCCYLSFVFLRIHWFSAKPRIVAVYPVITLLYVGLWGSSWRILYVMSCLIFLLLS